MKKSIVAILIAGSLLFIVSCNSGNTNSQNQEETQNGVSESYYTCTMHPEIHSDEPGNCPKCGMELVKAETSSMDTTHMHHNMDSHQ